MFLAEVAIGTVVTVEHVGGERAFRRRLMELGLLPGTRVEKKGMAPLGDPIELLVRGCSLSIRRAEAGLIRVSASVADDARRESVRAGALSASMTPGSEVRGTP